MRTGQSCSNLKRVRSQRAALDARPELTATARALQVARAQMAAEAMGLVLRGGGRPLPPDLLSDLQLVFSRLVTEDDMYPLAGISTPSRLARFLDQQQSMIVRVAGCARRRSCSAGGRQGQRGRGREPGSVP